MADHWHEFVYKAHCAGTRALLRRACAGRFAPPPFAPPARAQQVVSSNVVGYQKLTLMPGYNMIPNNFVTVDEEEDLYPIKEMFSDAENATANRGTDLADRIQVWDAVDQVYITYYRMTNRGGTQKWWGRADSATTETQDTFPDYGAGAFYYSQANTVTNLTISGQVKSTDTNLQISPGYNLLCNPYPIDLAFDTLDWSNATANRGTDLADRIQLWDAVNQVYVTYYYMTNRGGTQKWWGRADSATTPTTDSIPAGQGFFYYSQAADMWTLTIPTPVQAAGN